MLALKYMAKNGLSDKQISRELYDCFNHLWSTSTIARRRRSSGLKRESPFTNNKPTTTSVSCTLIKGPPHQNPKKLNNRIKNYFKDTDPDTLSFGCLCEYIASFFEDLANHPRGKPAPQEWWDTIRDKVISWYAVRGRTDVNYSTLSRSQILAYDFCEALYTKSVRGSSRYRVVYSLYREWRTAFLATQGK